METSIVPIDCISSAEDKIIITVATPEQLDIILAWSDQTANPLQFSNLHDRPHSNIQIATFQVESVDLFLPKDKLRNVLIERFLKYGWKILRMVKPINKNMWEKFKKKVNVGFIQILATPVEEGKEFTIPVIMPRSLGLGISKRQSGRIKRMGGCYKCNAVGHVRKDRKYEEWKTQEVAKRKHEQME